MSYKDEYINYKSIRDENHDLIIYHYGMEECKPCHSYGPALRDHFLMHYILSGSGTFQVDGKSYSLHKNQGFLICPDIVTYYEASSEDPWLYTWVGFKGIKSETLLKSANLDRNNPIFSFEGDALKRCFEEMRASNVYKYGYELRLQGILSILLSELIEQASPNILQTYGWKDMYIKKSLQFIEANYSHHISIEALANHIGLNKNYFSTLFRQALGVPPQEYIVKYKINKACELLKNEDLSIGEISRSIGYTDPLGFSKLFKQIKGVSPKLYRNSISYKSDYSEK